MALVDFAVGWFLGDPLVWRRLRELFIGWRTRRCWRAIREGKVRYYPLPIPQSPPGTGSEWKKIFDCIFAKFRVELTQREGGVGHANDARWTSYSLSYQALRRCARLGMHTEYPYVYRACVNSHGEHLASRDSWGVGLSGEIGGTVEVPWSEIDLRLDIEEALGRLAPKDADICRRYLVEELTFEEIGEKVGLHESTVQRRFVRNIPAVRKALKTYEQAEAL